MRTVTSGLNPSAARRRCSRAAACRHAQPGQPPPPAPAVVIEVVEAPPCTGSCSSSTACRCSVVPIVFRPSVSCTVADTGQTLSQGAFSQWWQVMAVAPGVGLLRLAAEVAVDAVQCISRPQHLCLPTMGMLFSAWHATTHALQPMQLPGPPHAPAVFLELHRVLPQLQQVSATAS